MKCLYVELKFRFLILISFQVETVERNGTATEACVGSESEQHELNPSLIDDEKVESEPIRDANDNSYGAVNFHRKLAREEICQRVEIAPSYAKKLKDDFQNIWPIEDTCLKVENESSYTRNMNDDFQKGQKVEDICEMAENEIGYTKDVKDDKYGAVNFQKKWRVEDTFWEGKKRLINDFNRLKVIDDYAVQVGLNCMVILFPPSQSMVHCYSDFFSVDTTWVMKYAPTRQRQWNMIIAM